MVKIIGINRELNIARVPGLDQSILNLVAEEFKKKGFEVEIKTLKELRKEDTADIILNMARSQEINQLLFEKEIESNLTVFIMSQEEELCNAGVRSRADVVLNMARGPEINKLLFETEKQGVFVVNPPRSVLMISNKKDLNPLLVKAGVSIPETKVYKVNEITIDDIKEKSVLKAGNRHSIYFTIDVGEKNALDVALKRYREEGIEEIIAQKFIEGKFMKYYAVGDMVFLPVGFEAEFSKELAEEIKRQIGLIEKTTDSYILGGDLIIADNKVYFTDVNDWPSYSGAGGVEQKDIAPHIADYIEKRYQEFKK